MKILISGATGFLGQHLIKLLKNQNHEIIALGSKDADLKQAESLLPFKDMQFDKIYHLAAWTQAGDFCLKHSGEQWIINNLINTHMLKFWQEHQLQAKMIAMGTSCAYAEGQDLREENYMIGQPVESLYTYAMTKRMLYQGLRAIHQQYGGKYLYLVPSTLYGANYHLDGRQMHFIFDLVRKFLRCKYLNEDVILWGDGYQRREIIHVDDFLTILQQLDRESNDCDIYNIGAHHDHSIRDFADILCDIIGIDKARIQYDTSRYVGAKSKCLNMDKTLTKISGYDFIALRQGITSVVSWFIDHKAYL